MGKPKPYFTIEKNLSYFEGLRPRAWISADQAFAREEIKKIFFDHGMGISSETLVRPETIAALGLDVTSDRFLGSLARQELLRHLMAQSAILSFLPELKRMRRAQGFYKKLDQAIQAGRRVAGSDHEAETMDSVLARRLGSDPVREEVSRIAIAYETWLESQNYWDDARLLQEWVIRFKQGRALSSRLKVPQKIFRLEALPDGGLVQSFWDGFTGLFPDCEVVRVPLVSASNDDSEKVRLPELEWGAWHTLDDAADALAERLSTESPEQWDEQVILIPDDPSVRRSLTRAFLAWGIPSSDPRDPTRVRTSEAIKWFLNPLRLVSSGFDRKSVLAWAKSGQTQMTREQAQAAIREIEESGFRAGIQSLYGPRLSPLVLELQEIQKAIPSRVRLSELKKGLFQISEKSGGLTSQDQAWLDGLFEQFETDLIRTRGGVQGSGLGFRAHPRWWLERLSDRISQARPGVIQERPIHGLRISKLGQAPFSRVSKLHLFGLPARWIDGDSVGDLWLSDRAREILAAEFQISSLARVQHSRKALLQSWREGADRVTIWDARYDWNGAERESLLTGLRELGWEPRESDREPDDCGAHLRFSKSFGFIRPEPAREIRLAPIASRGREEISATDLDRQSRCGFLGLGLGRWKLYDGRHAEPDLWGDVRGILYHHAVRTLVESRQDDGSFLVEVDDAIERAWAEVRPKGFLRSNRLVQSEKARMKKALLVFCEKEAAYVRDTGNRVLQLEGPKLTQEFSGVRVSGIPDRLDETKDGGILVIDYKTSASQPNGREILENDYALQLPFYALAASGHFQKRPIGFQFLAFDRVGRRTLGLFFTDWNFPKARKGGSLFTEPPEDVFSRLRQSVEKEATKLAQGVHSVAPKIPARECKKCRLQDACGIRRALNPDLESDEEGASSG
ncbi:MAG: PD-(D/E)XK nuclease family protein [Bdellovibrionales bacterium]|nr:PD-(D/E)XK nuclease family protein [Bdellovibrionales bacterium]